MEVINILTVLACFMCVFPFVSYELTDDEFYYVAITGASIILFLILLNVVLMSVYLLIHQCKARPAQPHFEVIEPVVVEDKPLDQL